MAIARFQSKVDRLEPLTELEKTGNCTHLPDLPRQLAISLYICIILCKGYSAFLIRVFHSSCKSVLQCMRFFASEAKSKLPLPWTCGHGKGVQIS